AGSDDLAHELPAACAKSAAYGNLASPLGNVIRHNSVDPCNGEREGDGRGGDGQPTAEPGRQRRTLKSLFERRNIAQRKIWIDGSNGVPEARNELARVTGRLHHHVRRTLPKILRQRA